MLSQKSFDELAEAFDRHLKHHRTEPRDTVLQMLMDQAQQGKFDWDRFRGRHAGYADYHLANGWQWCPLTFLGWIRAGMPPAPPEKKTAGKRANVAVMSDYLDEEGFVKA